MDSEALARAVDDRIIELPPGPEPARLFAVHVGRDGVRLALLWSGYARELPPTVVPPADADAIALDTAGWAAPMDGAGCWPSQHPQRRRIHHTAMVCGEMEDVSVLRCEGSPVEVLRGAIGVVAELLVGCWLRRPVCS